MVEVRKTTFRIRRDIAANWTADNPVLNTGEPAIETDTLKVKYGDGTTAWNDLDYAAGSVPVTRASLRSACMAKLSADLVSIDASGGYNIPWGGADEYDDDGWHDPASNNTRLTVPTGVDRVKVGYSLQFNNVTPATYIYALIAKNGSSVVGSADFVDLVGVPNPRITGQSGPLVCSPGDYFTIILIIQDTSVDLIAATSAFWIEAA